jgi:mono/diheme cytochrome c family protein
MNTSPLAVLFAAFLVATVSACSGGDPDTLNNDPGGGGTSSAPTTRPATPTPSATGAGSLPPGVTSGTGKEFFLKSVAPELNAACGSCHTSGSAGAPVFLNADANLSYGLVENRGYIMTGSILVRKGAHLGPALTANQAKIVNDWVALEIGVRGNKAPTNIFSKLGTCVDVAKFAEIRLDNLRTIRRTNENANNCTGCNAALCSTCHKEGEAGFHSNFGGLGTLTSKALQENAQSAEGVFFISKYVATNGTALTAATGLKDKAAATATDQPYGHPLYQVSPEMDTALQAFAQDVITKYNAKQCGQ